MALDNPYLPSELHEQFIEKLQGVCGRVLTDEARLAVFETDGLTAKRQMPAVAAIPATLEEVQAVCALCHEWGVPLVPRGAGTGLSGGATPHVDGVLLVMTTFNRICQIDEQHRLAVVEPGVTNLSISQAVGRLDCITLRIRRRR